MRLTGFQSNIDINPRDRRELAFVKDFRSEDRETGVTLNVDSIEIVNEAYDALDTWLYDIFLGYGRFENIPAQALTASGTIIPMYLDLANINIGFDDASVGIGVRKSDGHFFTDANVLTFELMRSKGFLPPPLLIKVPYIIIPNNLAIQKSVAIVTILSIAYQLYHVIMDTSNAVGAFLDPGGGTLVAIIQTALLVAFIIILVIELNKALQNLFILYFPNIRYFKAIRDVDLIRQGCAYLGYTLESNLLNLELNNMCTMGVPEAVPEKSIFRYFENEQTSYFNKGYPTAQDTVPTLGDMIKFIEKTFNAKTFIYDGIVKIERRSYFQDTASIILAPTLSDQDGHDDVYTFNESEMWGRTYDHWAIDYTDAHSPDTFSGMKAEYITEPINVLNPDLVRLIGLKENAAPFALAARKGWLTKVEEIFNDVMGDLIEFLESVGANGSGTLTSRVGVMIIEQQYFNVTKKLWLEVDSNNRGRQPGNYKDIISMDNIYNGFKQDLQVISNNYTVKTMTVPFTDANFISLLMNNFVIYEPTGQAVEVTNITWYDEQFKADIEILLPSNSGFNTKTTKLA